MENRVNKDELYGGDQYNYFSRSELIVFDTSILINLYELDAKVSKEIIEFLNKNIGKIWIPSQVYEEFKKHSHKESEVRKNALKIYSELAKDLKNCVHVSKKEFGNNFKIYKKNKFENIKELEGNINTMLDSINEKISLYEASRKTSKDFFVEFHHKNDEIQQFVNKLQKGEKFLPEELINIFDEGEKRYKYKIPPGYMDDLLWNKDGKHTPEKYGDLLIWKEIIKKVSEYGKNKKILLISNDDKKDWVNPDTNKILCDLKKEFSFFTNNSEIEKINLTTFLKICDTLTLESKIKLSAFDSIDYLLNTYPLLKKQIIINIEDEINYSGSSELDGRIKNTYIEINELKVTTDKTIILKLEEADFIEFIENKILYDFKITGNTVSIINDFLEVKIFFESYVSISTSIKPESLLYVGEENEIIDIETTILSAESINNRDICSYCNMKEGIYFDSCGEYICESCSSEMVVCDECGNFYSNDYWDATICRSCYERKFDKND